jgi:very-short-patch-repair endonuclease
VNIASHRRYFDVYVVQHKLLIEFDGTQHYKFPNGIHKTRQAFDASQVADVEKVKYALANGIRILRLDYSYVVRDKMYRVLDVVMTSTHRLMLTSQIHYQYITTQVPDVTPVYITTEKP